MFCVPLLVQRLKCAISCLPPPPLGAGWLSTGGYCCSASIRAVSSYALTSWWQTQVWVL